MSATDHLDRAVVLYLVLPLAVFLPGWLQPWAAIPLCLCALYALRPLVGAGTAAVTESVGPGTSPRPVPWQIAVAGIVGIAWTFAGGTLHQVFANADWPIRDAVLHDLVTGKWPVGYGAAPGAPTLLRAPLGYYLPAALAGKALGLSAAHVILAAWTALGAALFLLQVLTCMPARLGAALAGMAVMVGFSGLDVIGTVLRDPPSVAHWDITAHLEWWAARYQYSSTTTQLFWVPNHALGAWLAIGMLARRHAIENLLPIVGVAVMLWSPLAALGLVPFVLLRIGETGWRARNWALIRPRVWAAALPVGLAVAGYLTLDAGRIPKGWTFGQGGSGAAGLAEDLAQQAEFFLLEAGLIGVAVLVIRRSTAVTVALCVLAVLPAARFGASNDLVMRASIPSLTVLALGACRALLAPPSLSSSTPLDPPVGGLRLLPIKRGVLGVLLLLGAVTPFQEFARAARLRAWPANLDATLIDASCGAFLPHYVARRRAQPVTRLLKPPRILPSVHEAAAGDGPKVTPWPCKNPAVEIERERAAQRGTEPRQTESRQTEPRRAKTP